MKTHAAANYWMLKETSRKKTTHKKDLENNSCQILKIKIETTGQN